VIADDSAEMRSFVRSALAADHDDIVEAADGRELLWQLLRHEFKGGRLGRPPMVVITDVRMPWYDGLQVVEALREIDPRIPVIVITAFPDDAVRAEVTRLHAILLAKPFTRSQLRRAVAEVESGGVAA
jgi:two-component system NtrC family response regulator/two-component system nitrogen regulation response regulator GlnG